MCKSTFKAKPTRGLCLRAPIRRSTTHYTYALTFPETHSVIRQCNNIQPAKQNSHQYSISYRRVCQLINTCFKAVCHLVALYIFDHLSTVHQYFCIQLLNFVSNFKMSRQNSWPISKNRLVLMYEKTIKLLLFRIENDYFCSENALKLIGKSSFKLS